MAAIALSCGRVGLLQLPQIGRRPAADIVMIHGLGASCGFWYASAVQWFRRFGRVTLFDLPGHGDSAMPASGYAPAQLAGLVGELLDQLQIDRAHLVAHSFGGSIALAFALAQPHRVHSLVLADVRLWAIEPAVGGGEPTPWIERARDAGLMLDDPRVDVSVQVLIELARLRLAHDELSPVFSEVLPGARSLFRGRRTARRWLQLMETTSAYDEMIDSHGLTGADLARLSQPVLAIYGGASGRERSALALHASCSHCELRVISHAGHFFPLTRPNLFARPVLAFLRSTVRGLPSRRRRRRGAIERTAPAVAVEARRLPPRRRRQSAAASDNAAVTAQPEPRRPWSGVPFPPGEA